VRRGQDRVETQIVQRHGHPRHAINGAFHVLGHGVVVVDELGPNLVTVESRVQETIGHPRGEIVLAGGAREGEFGKVHVRIVGIDL
jgi:hypothetical protein